MLIADLEKIAGRTYPARRWTRNLVGGASPIQAGSFAMGLVVLEPNGGQVPWHHQEQEEVYFLLEGTCEMCLGAERGVIEGGQAVFIPPGFSGLTFYSQVIDVSDLQISNITFETRTNT